MKRPAREKHSGEGGIDNLHVALLLGIFIVYGSLAAIIWAWSSDAGSWQYQAIYRAVRPVYSPIAKMLGRDEPPQHPTPLLP